MKSMVILTAFALAAAPSLAAPATTAESQIIEIERVWNAAVAARDPQTVDTILSQDFTFIGADGKQYGRADLLRMIGRKDIEVDPFTTEEVQVRIYGDTAVVTGRFTQVARQGGKSFTMPLRYTDVYVREGKSWKAVSAQATLIRDAK